MWWFKKTKCAGCGIKIEGAPRAFNGGWYHPVCHTFAIKSGWKALKGRPK